MHGKVNLDECWLWAGSCFVRPNGDESYGYMYSWANGKQVNQLAHRVAYENFVGDIPTNKEIDHLCEVKRCINPDHLEAVSHKVNARRTPSPTSIRNRIKTICKNGHKFDESNTGINKYGNRWCKMCSSIRHKSYRQIAAP